MQLNDRGIGNINDAYSIDRSTRLKNTSRPKSTRDGRDLILASKLKGRPRRWGADIVCPTNMETHVTLRYLTG